LPATYKPRFILTWKRVAIKLRRRTGLCSSVSIVSPETYFLDAPERTDRDTKIIDFGRENNSARRYT
ncbi:hypothetical protein ARMGADRAFT_1021542, partial [Armillaria gallica]